MGDEREPPKEPPLSDLAREAEPKTPPDVEAPSFEIPEVLQLEDPREILIRLSEEDPFELRARLPRRCRERAFLLPNTRLVMMAMARMAIAAKSYTGKHPIEAWVEVALDVAIDDMLDEQREEERRGLPVPESQDAGFYTELAEIFGCPLLDARMACTTLNGMSEEHRQAFHAVVAQGIPPARWADETRTSRPHVEKLLREVGTEVQTRLVRRHKARRRNRRL
jgi:hypothetical protein